MCMTDMQFETHLRSLLRQLEVIKKEVESGGKSEMLDTIIKDIESALKKP